MGKGGQAQWESKAASPLMPSAGRLTDLSPSKGAPQVYLISADASTAERGLMKGQQPSGQQPPKARLAHLLKAGFYLLLNVASATCIVFANKSVFAVYHFHHPYALTLVHTLTTFLGMYVFAAMGMYERKSLPIRPLLSLAAAFVGYIVFWNISLQVNTVGFYQLSKICITPAVLAFDALTSKKYPTRQELAAVAVLCAGVTLATVTDSKVATNLVGLAVGLAAVCFTAVYQVFVGSKQKELKAGSMALMAGYTPVAAVMLALLVPIFEPLGVTGDPQADTLIGYPYTFQAVAAIMVSALLGLLVSLSTFLCIGATSSVTYNVVGHIKTVVVLSGGCLLFGDEMPLKRFLGVCLALSGIFYFSALKMQEGAQKEAASASASASASTAASTTSGSAPERDSLGPRIQSAKSFANLTERSSTL